MIWFFISIITYIVGCPMIVKPPMNPTYLDHGTSPGRYCQWLHR